MRKIVATIAETSDDFPVGANLRNDLGIDSVRALEVVFEIERAFEITIPDDRYGEVAVFSDVVKLVTSLVPHTKTPAGSLAPLGGGFA